MARPPEIPAAFGGDRRNESALAGFETAIGLVDDVSAATAADHAVITVTALERLEAVANLHRMSRLSGRLPTAGNSKWRG